MIKVVWIEHKVKEILLKDKNIQNVRLGTCLTPRCRLPLFSFFSVEVLKFIFL